MKKESKRVLEGQKDSESGTEFNKKKPHFRKKVSKIGNSLIVYNILKQIV